MVIYDPRDWFSLIFRFHKSDTFRRLIWVLLGTGVYAFLVAYIEIEHLGVIKTGFGLMYDMLGFVISLLLVFRTNTAYDRWWEGRKQWGALVNATRNLSLKVHAFVPKTDPLYQEVQQLIKAYPDVLRYHLRNEKNPDWPVDEHEPNYIASRLYDALNKLFKAGYFTGEQFIILDNEMKEFTDITGACERIKNSPIPFSYNIFIKKFMFIYVMTMPFTYVYEFGYAMIPVVILVFYVLGSLELIAEEIEEPFGLDANDLPTDTLTKTIGQNIDDISRQ